MVSGKLIRVGTTYIPVTNVDLSAEWYVRNLGAELSYKDADKAIPKPGKPKLIFSCIPT